MLSNDLKQALNNLDLLNVKNDKEAEFYDKINYLFSHDNIIKEKYKLLVDEIKNYDNIKLVIDNTVSKHIEDNYIKENKVITKDDKDRIKLYVNNSIDNLVKGKIIKDCLNNNNKNHIANTRSFLKDLADLIRDNRESQQKNHSLEEEEERRKKQLQKEIEDALSY